MENLNVLAVIIDVYGTVIDSENNSISAWSDIFAKFDNKYRGAFEFYRGDRSDRFVKKPNRPDFDILLDGRRSEIIDYLSQFLGCDAVTAAALVKAQAECRQRIESSGGLRSVYGTNYLFNRIKDSGLPYLITSTSTTKKMQRDLAKCGVNEDLYRFCQPPERVKSKPAPDFYKHCARKICVRPENCIVVENSLVGMRSALNAGCITFLYDYYGDYQYVVPNEKNLYIFDSLEKLADEICNNIDPKAIFFSAHKKKSKGEENLEYAENLKNDINLKANDKLSVLVKSCIDDNIGKKNSWSEINDFFNCYVYGNDDSRKKYLNAHGQQKVLEMKTAAAVRENEEKINRQKDIEFMEKIEALKNDPNKIS